MEQQYKARGSGIHWRFWTWKTFWAIKFRVPEVHVSFVAWKSVRCACFIIINKFSVHLSQAYNVKNSYFPEQFLPARTKDQYRISKLQINLWLWLWFVSTAIVMSINVKGTWNSVNDEKLWTIHVENVCSKFGVWLFSLVTLSFSDYYSLMILLYLLIRIKY